MKLEKFGHTLIDRLDRLTENTRIASISMLLSYPVSLINDSVDMFVLALKEALTRGIGSVNFLLTGDTVDLLVYLYLHFTVM